MGQRLLPSQAEQGALGVAAFLIVIARRHSREERQRLVDGRHRIDAEVSRRARLRDVLAQHQVPGIRVRDDRALSSGESVRLADREEALDLLRHRADRLHMPELVDRAGHREVLAERYARERAQEAAYLRT